MTRLILLDTGLLGMVTNPKESEQSHRCKTWLRSALDAGLRVMVPEIADYEVRRELLRAGKVQGVRRLDELAVLIGYLPIETAVMREAAEFWAKARKEGFPTADDKALDGDVILAAQAVLASREGFEVTVATTNVDHLARFVDARAWEEIPLPASDQ
jgi:predicted nucleic acid-binding protein